MERAKQLLLAVILLGFVSAFFWPMEFPVDGQFWRTVMDSAHLPLFALITFICYGFVSDRNLSHERKCKYAFIAAAIISIAIELTQPLVGRTRSDLDQIYGIGGALCGAALLFLWPRRGEKQVLGSMILLLLVFVFATSAPAMKKYSILNWRSEQFPILGSFEDSTDYLLWRPNYYAYTGEGTYKWTTNYVSQGEFAMAVDAKNGGWPGVDYDAGEQDWSGYEAFAFDLYNPADSFVLRMRIDDDGDCSSYGKRFDLELDMDTGWNHVNISASEIAAAPEGRSLNLKAIRRIVMFISEDDAPRRFHLDNIRLKKTELEE
jgi:hypothetical protein